MRSLRATRVGVLTINERNGEDHARVIERVNIFILTSFFLFFFIVFASANKMQVQHGRVQRLPYRFPRVTLLMEKECFLSAQFA